MAQTHTVREQAYSVTNATRRDWSTISIAGLIQSHWRLILLACVAGGILSGLFTAVEARVFNAHTKLLVRTGREETVMATGQASAQPAPRDVSEEDVNSEMELLRSHDLLGAVVQDCNLARVAKDPKQQQKQFELALLNLYKHLEISAVRKTNIINVGYYAGSPTEAASVLRDLISRYLSESVAAHGTPNSLRFFSDEMNSAKKQMISAQEAASSFREHAAIYDPAQERTTLVAQLASARDREQDAQAQIQEQRSRRAALLYEQANLETRIPTQVRTAVNQPLVEVLESKLNDLRANRIALAAKYKAGDRLLTTIDTQIASTTEQLREVGQLMPTEQTSDVNPLRQTISAELSENQVLLQGLAARKQALGLTEKDILTRLDQLDQQAVVLANLERTQDESQNNYALLQGRVEESRMAGQMDQQKIANVVVVENPVASPIPTSPSLRLNLLVGLCAGTVLGFLLSLLGEASWWHRPRREVVHV